MDQQNVWTTMLLHYTTVAGKPTQKNMHINVCLTLISVGDMQRILHSVYSLYAFVIS
jgi:hypothetical protein